jgi:aminoglycoside phosphotransferase (APT) family kinase protein
MPGRKMHADELETDADLVERLLAVQFPEWASLPIEPVPSSGTDNALYRLGDDMVVRLPRIHWAVGGVAKEQEWLPRLRPHLPVQVPVPLAQGAPGEGYPWDWSVYTWLEGENPVAGRLDDPVGLAMELARFVAAMRQVELADGPASRRGVPLVELDDGTRTAIAELEGLIDTDSTVAAWEAALRAPVRTGPSLWTHGDLMPGNLLVRNGRLAAVIDFGVAGVGDPACDLIVAWTVLPAEARGVFRAGVGADDAMWARGRGWALLIALIQLPYYKDTTPALAAQARHVIREVLADDATPF